jgi:ATP-dependent RNA helicase SUPV3L1/SUV3
MAAPVTALLGPTNTGKTHLALEHMQRHRTGMIGFPLRLLARENYDKLVRAQGAERVALVTGEERIIPAHPRYFVCTVEAMPLDRTVDFLAVDEVQLAADRERGHVFTDRILHARGRHETLLLGAGTIRPLLSKLLPQAAFISRPRLSTLSYVAPKRLGRLPRRSAVIAFSLPALYELAERLRREVGGVAVVFGALSPRTRNAQVAMYQAGEVDYLVATDAIGMGLNLDIDHVTFTSLTKFDGQGPRALKPAEIAQIAGRAGRHLKDGTFSPTTELGPFDERLVSALQEHRFEPLESLYWRSPELDFSSPTALLQSLEARPPIPELVRMKTADDHVALEALLRDAEVRGRLATDDDLRRLWDVCQVPDFRSVMHEGHTRLLSRVFAYLSTTGELPHDWVAEHVAAIDRTDGDLDTLLVRIASVRTWTYVAHRPSWLRDPEFWRQRTRAVEDRLSDALHERLTEQFVDRRAALIARHDPDDLVSAMSDSDEVLIQGLRAGRMDGFVFVPEPGLKEDARALLAAANRAVRADAAERVRIFADEPDHAFSLSGTGQVLWRRAAVARLVPGEHALAPRVEVLPTELLEPGLREKVRRRLTAWIEAEVRRQLAPLARARESADLSGTARGLAFVLAESLGTVSRRSVAPQIAGLDGEDRRELQRAGISIGRLAVWTPGLKAESIRLRALLWRLRRSGPVGEARLPDGRPSVPADPSVPSELYAAAGYLLLGPRAVRVDRAEHLAASVARRAKEGPFAAGKPLADIVGASPTELPAILKTLGYVGAGEGHWARPGKNQGRTSAAG